MTIDEGRWHWTSDYGRDEILRDQVDDLHSRLADSHRQSSRLSSQLAEVTGSIEQRLRALSVAFDAYVELGDIRDQLAGYPDTSQIRREVRDALTALAGGRPVPPVGSRDLPYWLPHATNAVVAIAGGTIDREAEATARSLSPDAELFMVAACGAVGHGAAVGDRLPGLLVSDGMLSSGQYALWVAAYRGVFGDVLGDIEELWWPALAPVEQLGWVNWVGAQAGSGGRAAVEWIADQIDADQSAPAAATAPANPDGRSNAVDGLRAVIADLVGRGFGEEAELLRRARELRARIEAPTGPALQAPAAEDGPDRPSVVAAVRSALLDTDRGTPVQAALLRWLAPGLLTVLDYHEREAAKAPADIEVVSTAGGPVVVSGEGPEPGVLEQRVAWLSSSRSVSPTRGYVLAAGTGLSAVLTVLLAVVGSLGWTLFLALVTFAGAVAVALQWQARRLAASTLAADIASLDGQVVQAHATVRSRHERWRIEQEALSPAIAEVRRRLQSLSDCQPSSAAEQC